jgi:hypothetical protein
MVRSKIAEMPGKLDHATVVAYRVGVWAVDDEEHVPHELGNCCLLYAIHCDFLKTVM